MAERSLATMFGVGNAKRAPGTFGSLAALVLAYPLLLAPFGWAVMVASIPVLTYLGARSSTRYMQARGIKEEKIIHDPSAIVVDEWAGQWLTFSVWHGWLFTMTGSMEAGITLLQEIAASPQHLAYGFVLFRFFDILKPWPIRWADRRIKGGFGVMFDDLLAGLAAGTVLFAIYFFGPLMSGTMDMADSGV